MRKFSLLLLANAVSSGYDQGEHCLSLKFFVLSQYRPRAWQPLHACKLRAIWWISTKNPHKKLACKFLHELLHADFLHTNLSVLLRWLILLTKVHASCVYFFCNNVADVKLETDIVEKCLFAVKEKQFATYFLLLRSCYDREHHVL